ncbi:DUF2933 domain-containing protein [Anoxybacillus flavithermus]|uniref:DUF2933 domain-containing protein n=1 Tax=Anoxybacillus flavithermus TaxID=33934 RepID=UPI0030B8A02C
MFYGCNVSCNQLPTSSNGDWSALIQRFSPHSYSIIYKRKEEGRFLPDFLYCLEVGVSSPKMMNWANLLILLLCPLMMLFCMRGHKHHKHHDHHSSDHHSIKELQDQITKLQTDNERLKEQLKSR